MTIAHSPAPPNRRPLVLALLAGVLAMAGCTDDPCAEYVDYMCDCEVDAAACGELRTAYEDADAELQDECAIALDDQIIEDEEEGDVCGPDTGGADTGV